MGLEHHHHHDHKMKTHEQTNRQIFGYNLAQGDGEACDPPLEISKKKMKYEMENFSRSLNVKHYNNAVLIAKKLGKKPPMVNTWELLDKSFGFPRVRQYNFVRQEMNNIEMF